MILPAQTIWNQKLLSPMVRSSFRNGLTHGLGPAGYDVAIDQTIWLWPGRFVLASTIEHFDLRDDVMGIVHDKSTWARRGVAVQNTVIEPAWSGYLTLEITVHGCRMPFKIKRGTPIAQVVFHRLEAPTELPYEGRYQDQPAGPQGAIEAK